MSLLTNKKIKQSQLIKLLEELGYVNARSNGQHLIFKHTDSKSLIALRHANKNEVIPLFIIASVYKNIISSDIATENQIIKILEEKI